MVKRGWEGREGGEGRTGNGIKGHEESEGGCSASHHPI